MYLMVNSLVACIFVPQVIQKVILFLEIPARNKWSLMFGQINILCFTGTNFPGQSLFFKKNEVRSESEAVLKKLRKKDGILCV